jgi:HAD superfamily hydrolase (TIGR01549 family)
VPKPSRNTDQRALLFDFDNTIAGTRSVQHIRESGAYNELTAVTMAKVAVYKPVPGILDALKERNIRVGIVTNSGAPYMERLLKHLGLSSAFDVVITYADVKAAGKKPSPKGLQLAMQKLAVQKSQVIGFVGDDEYDLVAAYHAGIAPILPTWASRSPVSTAPAIALSPKFLIDYLDHPEEYQLFAEKAAALGSANFARKGVYFLPLDGESNIVTLKEEMTTFCLGRYYSQRAATTAALHDQHALSKEIAAKEAVTSFKVPRYWVDIFAHVVKHGPEFMFPDGNRFDVITVIPSKQGKDPRLERLLASMADTLKEEGKPITCDPSVFAYLPDAQSQKALHANERRVEANRSLQLNASNAKKLVGKRVLVIDDVVTTGSTLARARALLLGAGAISAVGVALAKTVSIVEDERLCPKCARTMKVQRNKTTGDRFWGCSGYFEPGSPCKYSEPLISKKCPKCGRPMAIRVNSHSKERFWACTGFRETPKCSHSQDFDPNEASV